MLSSLSTLATLLLATSTLTSAVTFTCPPAPASNIAYRIDNMMVTLKSNGKAKTLQFDIAKSTTGSVALTCKPDLGVSGTVFGFKEGKRYECDGLGNGKYEFAYFGQKESALWLQYDGLVHSKVQGTAPIYLNCNGDSCTSPCPVYVAMLEDEPDD